MKEVKVKLSKATSSQRGGVWRGLAWYGVVWQDVEGKAAWAMGGGSEGEGDVSHITHLSVCTFSIT